MVRRRVSWAIEIMQPFQCENNIRKHYCLDQPAKQAQFVRVEQATIDNQQRKFAATGPLKLLLHGTNAHGHDIKLNIFKGSAALKFTIILQD